MADKPPETTISRILPAYITNRQGRDHVLYDGLLDLAHRELGLKSIRTRLLQRPTEANKWTAIVWAEVITERGIFTGIGDANAENVSRNIAPHIIRMAETRAKARALRDAANIKGAAFEELGPDEDEPAAPARKPAAPASTRQAARPEVNRDTGEVRTEALAAVYTRLYAARERFASDLGEAVVIKEDLGLDAAKVELARLLARYNDEVKAKAHSAGKVA